MVESQLRSVLECLPPSAVAPLHLFSSLDRDITLSFIADYPRPSTRGGSAPTGWPRSPAATAIRVARNPRCCWHLRAYDKKLGQLLDAHPDASIFLSFPGLGPVTAATLIPEMGEDRARFPVVQALLAETGLAPVTRASGRTRQIRFRYAANR